MSEDRIAALEARLSELEAREAIRQVLYTYARGVDRCDRDLLKNDVYFADAVDLHGWTFGGNAHEFADYVVEHLREYRVNRHLIANPHIELDGDRAFVESYYSAAHRIPVDGGVVDYRGDGRYLDIFERRGGIWRIAHRTTVMEMFWLYYVPEEDLTPAMPPFLPSAQTDRTDPVYTRFGNAATRLDPYRSAESPTAQRAAVFAERMRILRRLSASAADPPRRA